MHIRWFEDSDTELWDQFCQNAFQANFLHSRRFLSYHENRFHDASIIIEDDNGKWLGVMPAARSLQKSTMVVSHPGITYGGIVHHTTLQGEKMVAAMSAISKFYHKQGYHHLFYKPVPLIYHRTPAQDDLYALFRLNAHRVRCDLSCTIDLKQPASMSSRRVRSHKKAVKHGVKIERGAHLLAEFWEMLAQNLRIKHSVEPVHTMDEMKMLMARFPDEMDCICGIVDNQVVAGVLVFLSTNVCHAQYIASTALGQKVSALDSVMNYLFDFSRSKDKRWFDFGTSNESNGWVLNDSLYKFKSEFGGGGTVHDFFELPLHDVEVLPIHELSVKK